MKYLPGLAASALLWIIWLLTGYVILYGNSERLNTLLSTKDNLGMAIMLLIISALVLFCITLFSVSEENKNKLANED